MGANDMKQDQKSQAGQMSDRRSFLKLAGLGTVGTAAAAASSVTASAEPLAPKGNGDYRETDHVKRVYDLARF
jgi:hypothetical protein